MPDCKETYNRSIASVSPSATPTTSPVYTQKTKTKDQSTRIHSTDCNIICLGPYGGVPRPTNDTVCFGSAFQELSEADTLDEATDSVMERSHGHIANGGWTQLARTVLGSC